MPGLVMGVLNVTPDSFSDGGRFLDAAAAVAHGEDMIDQGVDIIDVGGESTRPGASPVSTGEETRRVVPVIEALAPRVRVSIDTRHPQVADAAVSAGASLINDVSSELHRVAADRGVGWVAMHMQGDPATMQDEPHYDDVVPDVRDHLVERVEAARRAGVDEIWIDPGIGFGKTLRHNLELLAHLDAFVATDVPVVVGTSRKSFLGTLLAASDRRGRHATEGEPGAHPTGAEADGPVDADPTPADDRLDGSVATAAWAFSQGVAMVRAHDVAPTVQASRVVGDEPVTAGGVRLS